MLWVSSLFLLQQHQGVLAELVGELLLHLEDLSRPGVVPQGAGHLLVSHGPLVALSLPPQCCHLVLVCGGKAEDAGWRWYPGHAVGHVWILQHLKEEMKEPHLSTCKHWTNNNFYQGWRHDIKIIQEENVKLKKVRNKWLRSYHKYSMCMWP